MFSNNLLAGVSGQGGAYSIEDSLRFNDNDSAYLSRTPASAGDRRTWTWSGWVKRGNVNSSQFIFTANIVVGDESFEFTNGNTLRLRDGNSATTLLETSALFRDPSGWYHIILVYDSANSSGAIYVNGVQQSLSTNNISLNRDSAINNNVTHHISGYVIISASYLDAYLAEVNFIDGQALTADDFGEIDASTGEWSPKKYSGTYGTNGFYLPFNGNANDSSGNGNNWTENNLASTDYMIDTPTNNFAVLNPLSNAVGEDQVLKEGNLHCTNSSSDYGSVATTIGASSGKWYCEGIITASSNLSSSRTGGGVLRFDDPRNNYIGAAATGWGYGSGGTIYNLGNNVTGVATLALNDVFMLAIDLDAGKMWVGKNGVWEGSGDPASDIGEQFSNLTGAGEYFFGAWSYTTTDNTAMNFGQDSSFAGVKTRQGNTDSNGKGDFYYTPPTGYLALCTDNLPAPAIEQPETQFNVVTYTGNGGTQSITGVGFQPDFVWLKERPNVADHQLQDSVRGATKALFSNLTDAESSSSTFLNSFDSDGFTVGSSGGANQSGQTYVAWCWKAGGTGVSNTDGSITSTVSANTTSGFSVVTYGGTGTVGHGLSQTPELILCKRRDTAWAWSVSGSIGPMAYGVNKLILNDTAALAADTNEITASNSTTFTTGGSAGTSGTSQVAYCFHSVEGFSKIGSYTGNGSTDGPFVYTGFKPAFVIIKATSISGESWIMFDNKHPSYNETNDFLAANLSSAAFPAGGGGVDMVSNGFKLRSTSGGLNTSGATFIYMAFAEHPLNYSTGR